MNLEFHLEGNFYANISFLLSLGHSLKDHSLMAIFPVKVSRLYQLPVLDTVNLYLKRRVELIRVFQTQLRRDQLVKLTYRIPGLLKLLNASHACYVFITPFDKTGPWFI